jgi:CDGSH iron-sulfur domain-containing protein 3
MIGECDESFAFFATFKQKKGMTEPLKPIIFQKSPIVQKVEPGSYWWCACGRSKSQPFCDGSHKGTGFGPKKVEITEAKTVAWCACKHSKNMPFCDGTHSTL